MALSLTNPCLFFYLAALSIPSVHSKDKINGHLRIASFYNPLARLPKSPPNSKGLIESELVEMLAQSLNFTYSIHAPSDVLQFGVAVNGSWSGVLGQVLRNEVDMTISFGPIDAFRYEITDPTNGIITDNVILMIPAPKKSVDASGVFTVYTPLTWVLITLSAVLVGTALVFIAHHEIDRLGEVNASSISMLIISSILGQGGDICRFRSPHLKLVMTAWFLSLVVLVYAYTGVLISKLTAPTFHYMVNSLEEAAEQHDIKLYVVKDSSAQEAFVTSPLKSFQEIAMRWRKYPKELLLPDSNTIVDLVVNNPKHGYIGGDVNAIFNIEKDRKKFRECRATLLPEKLVTRNNGLFLRKNSRFTKIIDKELLHFLQAGLGRYLEKRYASSTTACSLDILTARSNVPTKLTLEQLGIPFAFLVGGSIISFVALISELCHHRRHRRRAIIRIYPSERSF